MNATTRAAQLKALPPGLTIKEISAKLGYRSDTATRNACRRHGYRWLAGSRHAFKARRQANGYADWDWARRNTELAAAHGMTRQAVAQMRAKLERDGVIPRYADMHDCHAR